MKGAAQLPIFRSISYIRRFKSLISVSSRNSHSASVSVQCSDTVEATESGQFNGVIDDKDLLRKSPNGNLLVLDLIDRRALQPDAKLYVDLFKKCTDQRKLKEGLIAHAHFATSSFRNYVVLQNTVVNMYAKCCDMESARKVFDEMTERDMVSYTMLITGYSQNNEFYKALRLYVEMVEMGLKPNEFTFGSALKSAGGMQSVSMGRGIHGVCIQFGFGDNVYVGSALVDMYARCGKIDEAKVQFDQLKIRNEVSWNALIAAYAREGEGHCSLKLFAEMKRGGFRPTHFTYSSIFAACASNGAMEQAKWAHTDMIKMGVELVAFVGNTLLDMYGKGGSIEGAKKVFDRLVKKDVVSWNSMLTAYAQHGHGQEAIDLFEKMRDLGLEPNEISYLCVINACSHTGLVEKGLHYFELMKENKCVPEITHYVAIVDLLGRAGELERAERFILSMPIEPTAAIWKALLGACRVHKNMFLGGYAAERVFELDPYESGPHMLLSNIYASHGRRNEAARVRKVMAESGVKKEPACSWVEIGSSVHLFVANDDMHPQREEIRAKWEKLREEIKKMGYEADTSHVLWYADEREREERLQLHSEKLALAFALLNTPEGGSVSIKKNIRVCGDCHNAFKFVSKLVDMKLMLFLLKRRNKLERLIFQVQAFLSIVQHDHGEEATNQSYSPFRSGVRA
ncbi:pentatricopeptide repeat-containing protein At3g24000, mitochondrial isoform X1 [Salvia hispanica]|uniref:pentatricopeptide repeat-containing protein At3g24000, mitochondrial isoform X1 n=1 Tax=Salvia hispanica TaxID=49212 RepID=UPI002009567E|nr:pentatricopeptide repeat-containing protein At3g24000, mitochondrial isoform X1 [Salvia hispanica]